MVDITGFKERGLPQKRYLIPTLKWVINRIFKLLEVHVFLLGKQTYVHVTPYQVCCKKRPWIGEEEGIFTKKLVEKEVNVSRKLHLENSNGTLEDHFNLLKEVFFYTP